MNKNQIIGEIDSIVTSSGGLYHSWYVGVTDDPVRRDEDHRRGGRKTSRWRHWDADTK